MSYLSLQIYPVLKLIALLYLEEKVIFNNKKYRLPNLLAKKIKKPLQLTNIIYPILV